MRSRVAKFESRIRHFRYFFNFFLGYVCSLLLPVATAVATVETTFSTMKIIKNDLRNQIDDKFSYSCMVPLYREKKVFKEAYKECIMKTFQEIEVSSAIVVTNYSYHFTYLMNMKLSVNIFVILYFF